MSEPKHGALESSTRLDIITAANARDSPLLRLPAELRNRVYDYVFDPIRYKTFCSLYYGLEHPRLIDCNCLRQRILIPATCRQLYAETAALPLRTVVLDFPHRFPGVMWTITLPSAIKKAVKEIVFRIAMSQYPVAFFDYFELLRVAEHLPNLTCVYLRIVEFDSESAFDSLSEESIAWVVTELQSSLEKAHGKE
ncbi:hypothetical protein A1F94_007426 [Pyrenophora tritici-repentis]|nr:hypothetical protein PtrM4_137620 [Pyrenophora tritici-repentis]KAG9381772.1 hypothetical protein A1F94_007426 [Pyrenophora tritici-repentis]KAI1540980.1 hypothetical protein PtrSN001C_004709 [Pyrenophora tritici-repentis]KAI1577924.1 hypothetical protein PtrEW7m1_005738 [Pyrenophora tritici-repentis]KAI1586350.1 hypothetical protein PtrEW13061_007617 [Pyrenophora tritici-repentis]